jgi:hypothetical protein
LKDLLDKMPKEARRFVLDLILRNIKERDKIKQRFTKTERLVFHQMMETCGMMPAELTKAERKQLIEEVKSVDKLTEAEKRAYWKQREAFNAALDKAIPMFEAWVRNVFTKPQDLLVDVETWKKTHESFFESIRVYGEEMGLFAIVVLDMIWEALKNDIEPIKSYIKIDAQVRILLGDAYLSPVPATLRGYLKARGVTKALHDMTFEEIIVGLYSPEKESWLETVLQTLDMMFQQRYGWAEGAVRMKTIPELCIALEHAIEHDDPTKPSVWVMTGGKQDEKVED